MKSIFALVALLVSTSALAAEKTIVCNLDDSYISLNSDKVLPFNEETIRKEKDGKISVSFSESECEDSTSVTFEKEEFAALEKGKQAYGEIEHSGPDLQVSGTVRCKLNK